ncbi:polymorphic toxin type 50 domain-containing protein [Massilia sp. GCM10023247]|uniref:polymorphic toxin type 50 domain-containing protein n=1 Tax=Massilia sp. GCM10023247 TaxID=3252643 RepID=UPI0036197D4F
MKLRAGQDSTSATNIGVYVDPATGQRSPTTNGIIHESKKGVHIVPARPNDESK